MEIDNIRREYQIIISYGRQILWLYTKTLPSVIQIRGSNLVRAIFVQYLILNYFYILKTMISSSR